MASSYRVRPISSEFVDRAYPLMRPVAPALSLIEWRVYCCTGGPSPGARERAGEREAAILAIDSHGYVRGLCIHSVRDHGGYGRLVDVPVFVVASAADAEGVGAELLRYLRTVSDACACVGVRFWTMGPETWDRRCSDHDIRRADHGIFLPATADAAQAGNAVAACMLAGPAIIDRPSP